MQSERPTPETTAAIMESRGAWSFGLRHKMEQLERERDGALEECRHLRGWKREAMIVDSEWDEVREYIRNHPDAKLGGSFAKITLQFINERDEARSHLRHTIDELADEQQEHGITNGKLTECQMEMTAMREAIKEAHKAIRMGPYPEHSVLAKLKPFLA